MGDWWEITGDTLMKMLQEVEFGERAETVYMTYYSNLFEVAQ